jgi:Glycosyl transferase family 2
LEFSIVLAPRQNEFFVEIAEAIVNELELAGHAASISRSGFAEQRRGLVNVLLPPHEFYKLEGQFTDPLSATLKRTVFICAEQPGSSFFDDDASLASRAGAMLDINRLSIAEFARRGVTGVRHFPLGWTPSWSRVDYGPGESESAEDRSIDVLHLGIFSHHRAEAIAAAGNELQGERCRLILGDDHRVNTASAANFELGESKWQLLCDSRVLLNIHVAKRPYFEWLRVVQAMCCGCAVVSEHSAGYAPLVPGKHFLSGGPHALGLLARTLLDDEERRAEMARAAWRTLHDVQPFSASVATLIEAGHEVDRNPVGGGSPVRHPRSRIEVLRQSIEVDAGEDNKELAALKDIRLELMDMRRRLDRLTVTVAEGRTPPLVEPVAQSASYAAARPRVSVLTALYNYERHITKALDSAAAGSFESIELVVVDDGSRDDSCAVARNWIESHEDVPALLVRHPINRGLGPARNTALEHARGELVFVLDADNLLYRRCIETLVDALDRDPAATFAYGMLEMFDERGPVGLRSPFPWQPERFATGNFIDAMALIRTARLREHGGYTTDARLYGWEDYDLWCGVAQAGGHGVFVPTVIARYRATRHSMLSITDISARTAHSLLAERHPLVFADVEED